jgi:hypothetical protein
VTTGDGREADSAPPHTNPMRERARIQLPSVTLTLLSMVQALALELLWSKIREGGFLYAGGWPAAIAWAQIGVMGLGILQVWLFQVSLVLRFEWVPAPRDSILPFAIGALEFTLIDLIGPTWLGAWFFGFGLVFALSMWTSQMTFRRARTEPANAAFFERVAPAIWRDFVPAAIGIGAIWVGGGIVWATDQRTGFAFAMVVLTGALISAQILVTRRYWHLSLASRLSEPEADEPA